MELEERFSDPEEAVRSALDGFAATVWTSIPGIVQSFDAGANTVTVQPAIQAQVRDSKNNLKFVALPLLLDVPVVFYGNADYALVAKPKQNDEALVIFSCRAIDNWWLQGGVQQPVELRLHDINDGFALIGPRSKPHVLTGLPDDAMRMMAKDGTTYVEVGVHSVTLHEGNNGTITASAAGGTVAVSAKDVTVTATGNVSASAQGSATVAAQGNATLSAQGKGVVAAPFVALGPGGTGNLATMPAPAQTLLTNFEGAGPSAIYTNPTSAATGGLNTLLTGGSIDTGLTTLVGMGTITPTDKTNIDAALGTGMGGGGLLAANTALTTHTNLLSGLTSSTSATIPDLKGVVGLAGALDGQCNGKFGSGSTVLPTCSTGLNSSADVNTANTFCGNIVNALTLGTLTVAQVITGVNGSTTTLNGYVTNDQANYNAARGSTNTGSAFLTASGQAKNANPAVQTYMGRVASPSTIATLQTV